MNTLDFLRAVLADTGFYCVVGLKASTDERIQKFYPTIEAAAEVATQLQQNGFDSFFALSTFKDGASRKAPNTQSIKSFFLDLDCGVNKPYATQAEAIAALKEFCKTMKLPRPLIVNSGRGVHVYWPLQQAISSAAWFPIAESFKRACELHKLHADPVVTSDVSRILRVPGTLNFKDEPPKPVEILSTTVVYSTPDMFGTVGDDNALPAAFKDFVPREISDVNKQLFASAINNFKAIMVKTVAKLGCAQLGYIVVNQATIEEPLWRAALSIAAYCEDKATAIHKISSKHADYSFAYTEKKASEIKGPYTCATFEKLSPGKCDGCQYKKIITSPIEIGKTIVEATEADNIVVEKIADLPSAPAQTYVIPKYPPPYFRPQKGGVAKRVRGQEADIEIPVYQNDIYVVRRMVDSELGESVLVRLHMPKDGVREFMIPLTAIGSKEEFRKCVAAKGVAMIKIDELMHYISDWVNHLQMNEAADIAKRQFGWTDDKLTSFVVGDKEVFADRIDLNPPSKPTGGLFHAFKSRGSLEEWVAMMEFFNRPGFELHQYALGCGFGSPLMAFTAVNAAWVHLWSDDSGLGKTTVLEAAAGIWGDPMGVLTFENDTIATRMNRAEVYKNIILPLDEITSAPPLELSKLLKNYTHGVQRNRMANSFNVERERGDVWQQMCLSTGNLSLIDRISTVKAEARAEAQRVFELNVSQATLPSKQVTDELSLMLRRNYGTACIPFLQQVMKDVKGTRALLQDTKLRLDVAIGLTAKERFLSAAACCPITGLIITKRLGLHNFSISNIVRYLISTMKDTRQAILNMEVGAETTLNNYLAENYNNILRIRSTDDGRGKGDVETLIIPDGTPRISLIARYEYDVKMLYLMIKPLKDWCAKQHINYDMLIGKLEKGGTKAVKERKRMGKGTRMGLPAVDVITVNCTGFIDEETEAAIAAATASVPAPSTSLFT